MKAVRVKAPKLLKLDLGCGKNPREGFEGVDVRDFGQLHTVDLIGRWPWRDESVEEAHASHVVEHFTPEQRIHFVNELYRVLIPGGKCQVVTPHWASCRAYGDMTHQWPPVSEFWWFYLSKKWREENAPHNDGYTCNFDAQWGYSMRQELLVKNQEYQQFALTNYKEAAADMITTLTKC
jgi:predicted SAM-dependent methyltransferase